MYDERITIYCSGGCGRFVTLRKKKVVRHDFYVCNSKESGSLCKASVETKRDPNQVTSMMFNAAAHFTGLNHVIPDAEYQAAIARANRVLRIGMGINDQADLKIVQS